MNNTYSNNKYYCTKVHLWGSRKQWVNIIMFALKNPARRAGLLETKPTQKSLLENFALTLLNAKTYQALSFLRRAEKPSKPSPASIMA